MDIKMIALYICVILFAIFVFFVSYFLLKLSRLIVNLNTLVNGISDDSIYIISKLKCIIENSINKTQKYKDSLRNLISVLDTLLQTIKYSKRILNCSMVRFIIFIFSLFNKRMRMMNKIMNCKLFLNKYRK